MVLTQRQRLNSGAFWDAQAKSQRACGKGFSEQLSCSQLDIIAPQASETIIEIGPGSGRLTLPLARRSAAVTAIDPSAKMLALLRQRMREQGICNVNYVHNGWDEAIRQNQIAPHDVVVASYSLFMMDMRQQLGNMNRLACKRVCLFVPAELRLPIEVQHILHGAQVGCQMADHIILLNLLYDMGIHAELSYIPFASEKIFSSVDEALEEYENFYSAPKQSLPALKNYVSGIATRREDGSICVSRTGLTGALVWQKK